MKIHFKSIGMLLAVFSMMLFSFNLLSLNVSAAALTESDGLKYIEYENGDVKLYTGWTLKPKSGKRFYYKNGKILKSCWLTKKGIRQFYLTSDGSAAMGKLTISGTEYEFDSKGKLITDDWGIKAEVADVSTIGATLVITGPYESTLDSSDYFYYGSSYYIEKLTESGWKQLPIVNNDLVWADAGLPLKYNNHLYLQWYELYGELNSGRYRICKMITKDPGFGILATDDDRKTYYAYFTIS